MKALPKYAKLIVGTAPRFAFMHIAQPELLCKANHYLKATSAASHVMWLIQHDWGSTLRNEQAPLHSKLLEKLRMHFASTLAALPNLMVPCPWPPKSWITAGHIHRPAFG